MDPTQYVADRLRQFAAALPYTDGREMMRLAEQVQRMEETLDEQVGHAAAEARLVDELPL